MAEAGSSPATAVNIQMGPFSPDGTVTFVYEESQKPQSLVPVARSRNYHTRSQIHGGITRLTVTPLDAESQLAGANVSKVRVILFGSQKRILSFLLAMLLATIFAMVVMVCSVQNMMAFRDVAIDLNMRVHGLENTVNLLIGNANNVTDHINGIQLNLTEIMHTKPGVNQAGTGIPKFQPGGHQTGTGTPKFQPEGNKTATGTPKFQPPQKPETQNPAGLADDTEIIRRSLLMDGEAQLGTADKSSAIGAIEVAESSLPTDGDASKTQLGTDDKTQANGATDNDAPATSDLPVLNNAKTVQNYIQIGQAILLHANTQGLGNSAIHHSRTIMPYLPLPDATGSSIIAKILGHSGLDIGDIPWDGGHNFGMDKETGLAILGAFSHLAAMVLHDNPTKTIESVNIYHSENGRFLLHKFNLADKKVPALFLRQKV